MFDLFTKTIIYFAGDEFPKEANEEKEETEERRAETGGAGAGGTAKTRVRKMSAGGTTTNLAVSRMSEFCGSDPDV